MNGMIRDGLKAFLVSTLSPANAFPTPMTEERDIRGLMRSLRPVAPHKALVRLGPDSDGGYLIPDDLEGILACFSPGVSSVSGFEKACARRGIQVFLADKSVDGPAEHDDAFHFVKKFIGATTNDDFMTLDDWVSASLADQGSELLLQMDIEGSEYEVFLAASGHVMKRFRIIVAEFHWLDQLWSRPFFFLANHAFRKLLQTHACVHVHPNNRCGFSVVRGVKMPRVMEFTFVRRDRVHDGIHRTDFPHALDRDNVPAAPLVLPQCWY
jgi:hypothetical protein